MVERKNNEMLRVIVFLNLCFIIYDEIMKYDWCIIIHITKNTPYHWIIYNLCLCLTL